VRLAFQLERNAFMNLDDTQRKTVAEWIDQGLKLGEIQTRLEVEFGLRITYPDLRFLIDDLKLTPKDQSPPAEDQPAATEGEAAQPAAGQAPQPQPAPTGGVSVSVDAITRPGALVSGRVTFSDGNQAMWYLDQAGRLGVAPDQQSYKPSQDDLKIFQAELQRQLQRAGF
jgi:hypothetical protein